MPDQYQTLRQAKEALDRAVLENKKKDNRLEEDRKSLITSIGRDILGILYPLLEKIAENAKLNKEEIKQAISESTILVQQERPIVNVESPDVHVPEPRVTVNIPDVIVPEMKMPKEMDIRGWVQLQGTNLDNPLPVQLRDSKGKPVNLLENLTTLVGGSGGGGMFRNVKIGGFSQSAYSELMNPDNRLKVSTDTAAAGGLTDTELRAAHLDVQQVSGSNDSVNVLQLAGDALAKGTEVNTGFLRVIHAADAGVSVTATQLSTWTVDQLSGATWSVYANNPSGQGDQATALRVVVAGDSSASVSATQVGTWTVSLSGSLASTVATGPTAIGVSDDGTAPVQMGGIARQANPTAVAAGSAVKSTHDDLGRQILRPVQVRDLISTAYVSLTTGTETTLLAAVAGVYLDLIYLMGTNSSDAAVTVDIRAVTAGNVQTSIRIPANSTAGVALPVPIPQDETGNNWTADLPDITGTTVTLSALFSREI